MIIFARFPAGSNSVFRNVGRYKFWPRPKSARNYLPRPKSGQRYVRKTMEEEEAVEEIVSPYKKRSIFKKSVRYERKKIVEAESEEVRKLETAQRIAAVKKLMLKKGKTVGPKWEDVIEGAKKKKAETEKKEGEALEKAAKIITKEEMTVEQNEETVELKRNVDQSMDLGNQDQDVQKEVVEDDSKTCAKTQSLAKEENSESNEDVENKADELEKEKQKEEAEKKLEDEKKLQEKKRLEEEYQMKLEDAKKEQKQALAAVEAKSETAKSDTVKVVQQTGVGWGDPQIMKRIQTTPTGWNLRSG